MADRTDPAQQRWLNALAATAENADLAARTAAAAVEMTVEDPTRVPPDLLKALHLKDSDRAPLAAFLFKFRNGLVDAERYREGIRHADAMHANHRLDGLYGLVAGAMVERDGGKPCGWKSSRPTLPRSKRPT